jgi:hypothetical protein
MRIIVEITDTMHRFALFYMLAPTCFGSSLPSSGSFWIRLNYEYVKIQIDLVVYHITLVKWPVCRNIVVQSVVLPSCVSAGKPISNRTNIIRKFHTVNIFKVLFTWKQCLLEYILFLHQLRVVASMGHHLSTPNRKLKKMFALWRWFYFIYVPKWNS